MTFKYKKECLVVIFAFLLCLSVFSYIKVQFFQDKRISEPIDNVLAYYKEDAQNNNILEATTKPMVTSKTLPTIISTREEEENTTPEEDYIFPYEVAPEIEEDGSIIYDGLTITELTNKLNKSLNSYLTNTGYFFAKFTKDTGIDPYLSVAIVLLETGCKWKCSTLTTSCNNIGGLKGGRSCNGGSYSKYDSLEEGIDGYLNIIYNNYYLKGMTTAETMASTYAASSQWSNKVNNYITEIRAK